MSKYLYLVGSSVIKRWKSLQNEVLKDSTGIGPIDISPIPANNAPGLERGISNKKIFNFGISGLLTKNMLHNKYLKNLIIIESIIRRNQALEKFYPEYLIYYCGNNDLLHNINPNIIINNIKKFLLYTKEIFEHKTKIVYLSLLKSPKKYIIMHENLIDYINYNILLFCIKHNFIYVELNFLLNARNDYLKDGVHLSNKGYNKINNLLKIKNIL